MKWDLTQIYKDQIAYQNDLDKLNELITKFKDFKLENLNDQVIIDYLQKREEINNYSQTLFQYNSLSLACDGTNITCLNNISYLRQITNIISEMDNKFSKLLKNYELNEVSLKDYYYYLKRLQKKSFKMMSEEEENLYNLLMSNDLLLTQKNLLTSKLKVEYKNKTLNLSSIIGLSHSKDEETRKEAYFCELKALETISLPVAITLNGYKKREKLIASKRGYQSILESVLENNRIDQQILDALFQAMNNSLPMFRKYLKRKAEMLNNKNGLPFYNLFAPIGSSEKEYSIEEAKEIILNCFKDFSEDLYLFTKKVFDSNWIDYLPYDGKRNGAFCSSIHSLKQIRILTNYFNKSSDVATLAHELGHAYHSSLLFDENSYNSRYPMTIAESASILCEQIVKDTLKEANPLDLSIVENDLQDATQVIVDIMSRYLFEEEVFNRCSNELLLPDDLADIMKRAQLNSYGDGLDKDYLHPYMWIVKSHYYGSNFYNFPYAFGLLFSKGLYAKYKQTKDVEFIKNILRNSGKLDLYELGLTVGIDLRSVDFWSSSIDLIVEDIELFLKRSQK